MHPNPATYRGVLISDRSQALLRPRSLASHANGNPPLQPTMGAGHWLMEIRTESPGRSSWRLRPSNEQKAEERLSSGTCDGAAGRGRAAGLWGNRGRRRCIC